jgi:N-acetylmuramic acid 6-phosphate (MurNAc-6-P) etherase
MTDKAKVLQDVHKVALKIGADEVVIALIRAGVAPYTAIRLANGQHTGEPRLTLVRAIESAIAKLAEQAS